MKIYRKLRKLYCLRTDGVGRCSKCSTLMTEMERYMLECPVCHGPSNFVQIERKIVCFERAAYWAYGIPDTLPLNKHP